MSKFGIFHADWVNDPRIDAGMLAVLGVMCVMADKGGKAFPSQSTIAKGCNMSRPWVCGVLSRLCKLGIVEKTRQFLKKGGETSCLYKIVDHDKFFKCRDRDTPCPEPDTNKTTIFQKKNTLSDDDQPADADHEVTPPEVVMPEKVTVPADWLPSQHDIGALSQARPEMTDRQIGRASVKFVKLFSSERRLVADISAAWLIWMMNERLPPEKAEARPVKATTTEHNASVAAATLARINARRAAEGRDHRPG